MNTNNFADLLTRSLCNTLLHSLWQGLLLAIVTGFIVLLTRNRQASLRYNLLVAALLLFAAGTAVSFVYQWQQASQHAVIVNMAGKGGTAQPAAFTHTRFVQQQDGSLSPTAVMLDFIGTHYRTIILVWFFIICAKTVQLLVGLQGIYYMRRRKVLAVAAHWQAQLDKLVAQSGIQQSIQLLESGIAKVPMAIGYLKPVILLPLGLISTLPAEQTLAILAHELAHIRRRDYLVNLLQSLVEIVFFFNPAVWWISGLIRTERENCCDDIAIAQTGNTASYINALVSCQEYRFNAPDLAMGLKSNRSHLMQRVQRMVYKHNASLNKWEKALLSICLVAAVLITATVTSFEQPKKSPVPRQVVNGEDTTRKIKKDTVADTEPPFRIYQPDEVSNNTHIAVNSERHGVPHQTYVVKENNILYQLNKEDGAISSFQVNGKTVPRSEWPKYSELIRSLQQPRETPETPEIPETPEKAATPGAPAKAKTLKMSPPLPPVPATTTRTSSGPGAVTASVAATAPASVSVSTGVTTDATPEVSVNSTAPSSVVIVQAPARNGKRASSYVSVVSDIQLKNGWKDDSKSVADAIADELEKQKLISTRDNLRYTINDQELIINDVKQSPEVHRAIYNKFVKEQGDHISIAYASAKKN